MGISFTSSEFTAVFEELLVDAVVAVIAGISFSVSATFVVDGVVGGGGFGGADDTTGGGGGGGGGCSVILLSSQEASVKSNYRKY